MLSAGFLATISPLAMILAELLGPGAKPESLLPGNVSPHTYELRPSDLKKSSTARVLFWVDEGLDPWSLRLPTAEKKKTLGFLPENRLLRMEAHSDAHAHHGVRGIDPHFWTDPLAVESALPAFTQAICQAEPSVCEETRKRASKFSESLRALDRELRELMKPFQGRTFFVFHPSFGYFAKRYGLEMTEIVEPAPGKEPSVQATKDLITRAKSKNVHAVFSEPGIPVATTRMFAEAIGAKIIQLDPMGGVSSLSYREYLLGNARKIAEALR